MFRALVIAAMLALALPTLAAAQEHKDEHKPPPPHPGGGPPPPHPGGPPPPHLGGPPPPHPTLKPVFVPHGPPPGPLGGPPHPPGPPHAFLHPSGPQFTYRGHPFNRIHINPFIYPPGWAYREWAVGGILPPLFLARDYWYADWAALGVDPPPPGDEWVRYGPDLLLVDVNTGQVVDVIYGVLRIKRPNTSC